MNALIKWTVVGLATMATVCLLMIASKFADNGRYVSCGDAGVIDSRTGNVYIGVYVWFMTKDGQIVVKTR